MVIVIIYTIRQLILLNVIFVNYVSIHWIRVFDQSALFRMVTFLFYLKL